MRYRGGFPRSRSERGSVAHLGFGLVKALDTPHSCAVGEGLRE